MTDRQKIEYLKKINDDTESEISEEELAIIERNKSEWVTIFRKNINLFISQVLGINTFPFQHVLYYEMNESTTFMGLTSRGVGKSFSSGVFAVARCLLFPREQVTITASTFAQASIIVEEKIVKELFNREDLSPVLYYLYHNGYIEKKTQDQRIILDFNNGSTIVVTPPLPSARGLRTTIGIYDEVRLIKKHIIDSVFEEMAKPRSSAFLSKPKYREQGSRWLEETKSLYITSVRTANEWYFSLFKKLYVGYFQSRVSNDRIFCADSFLAEKYGLKTKKWLMSKKKTMADIEFRMEVLNEILRESTNAYFTIDMFQKNQKVKHAFKPPTDNDIISGTFKSNRMREQEFRTIFVDFSFAKTTGSKKNDLTSIGILSCYKANEKWIREVSYLETNNGSENEQSLKHIRELFWDFRCSYIVFDNRNGGTLNYTSLSKKYEHKTRPQTLWDNRGLIISQEDDIQFVTKSSMEDFYEKAEDKNGYPCMIPFNGNPEVNSMMWIDLALRLRSGDINLLLDDIEFQMLMEEKKEYLMMDSDEKAKLRLPYLEELALMNEGISLTAEWRQGQIKLKEPTSSRYTKDRIVSLAMGNLFCTKVIDKIDRNSQSDYDLDLSDLCLTI